MNREANENNLFTGFKVREIERPILNLPDRSAKSPAY